MVRKTISIIIPAYNEARRLPSTLSDIKKARIPGGYKLLEVIVVDDGSTDETDKMARGFGADLPVKVIKIGQKSGKGDAVRRGMLAAKGQLKLFMDADGSVSLSGHLAEFLKSARDGHHLVIGSLGVPKAVIVDEDSRPYRRPLGTLSRRLVINRVLPGIKDSQRGFKLFDAQTAELIFKRQTISGYGFDVEILVIAREHQIPVKELPVVWQNSRESKVGLTDYFRTLKEVRMIDRNRKKGLYG